MIITTSFKPPLYISEPFKYSIRDLFLVKHSKKRISIEIRFIGKYISINLLS